MIRVIIKNGFMDKKRLRNAELAYLVCDMFIAAFFRTMLRFKAYFSNMKILTVF